VLACTCVCLGLGVCVCVGLVSTIYIWSIYGNFGRGITKYAVIYGVHVRTYIQFWRTYVCVREGEVSSWCGCD
jgi:hypothetical protein